MLNARDASGQTLDARDALPKSRRAAPESQGAATEEIGRM
jgi:hypothetical protein